LHFRVTSPAPLTIHQHQAIAAGVSAVSPDCCGGLERKEEQFVPLALDGGVSSTTLHVPLVLYCLDTDEAARQETTGLLAPLHSGALSGE